MDQAVDLDMEQQKRSGHYLGYGIALSLLLHLGCSIFLLANPRTTPPAASITYLDLKMSQPAVITAPPEVKTPPVVPVEPKPQPSTPAAPVQAPQPQQLQPPSAAVEKATEKAPSHSIMGLGLAKGYFRSLGEGATLREDIKAYYLEMLQGINEKWWMDESLDKSKLTPLVLNIVIARTGEIVDQQIMISSGDPRYDRSVLAALKTASPLPSLPSSYQGDFFQAPIRLIPALNLLAW